MRHVRSLFSLTSSTVTTLALLVGLPWALVVFVGKPFPDSVPTGDEISWYLTNGQLPDAFWIGLLSLVLWFVWAQLVAGFVVELVAALRGLEAPSMPGLGFAQGVMGPLVARATMAVGLIGASPGIAGAATTPADTLAMPIDLTETAATNSFADSATTPAGANSTLRVEHGANGVNVAFETDTLTTQAPDTTMIEVARRDTFRSLAQTHLGSAGEWSALRDANIGRVMVDGTTIDASTVVIRAGWELALPNGAAPPAQQAPAQTDEIDPTAAVSNVDVAEVAGDEVVVREGEHFWALAESAMTEAWGRAPTDEELTPYWAEMVEANADRLLPPDDPDLIYPDQTFVVPAVPANPDLGTSAAFSADAPLEDRVTQDVGPAAQPEPVEAPPVSEEPVEEAAPVAAPVTATAARTVEASDGVSLLSSQNAKRALLATVGGLTLALAGITANRLRRRRLNRQSLAAPAPIDTPEMIKVEDQIRSLSNDSQEAANYLAALNPWLSHILSPGGKVPAIVAIKAGSNGVEILLDDPADLGEKFVPIGDDGKAWRLTSDMTDRMMKQDAGTAFAYSPMLIPIGDSPSGPLLVDFERLGALSITGHAPTRDGLLRNVICSALATPWFADVEIVAIGVPGLHPAPDSKIVVPDDPQAWAEQAAAEADRDAKQALRSPYEDRMDGLLSDGTARLVVVGPGFAGVAQHLAPAADLAWSQLALVTASEVPSEYSIAAEPDAALLEPVSLRFDVDLVDEIDLRSIDELLTEAEAETDAGATMAPIGVVDGEAPSLAIGGPSAVAAAKIAEINTKCGVELKILTSRPFADPVELTDRPTAIAAYIALQPGVPASKIRSEFWGDSSDRAPGNMFSKLRRALGTADDGTRRLTKAEHMRFHDVGNDYERFERFIAAADATDDPSDIAAYLDAALELIEGFPGKHVVRTNWWWLSEAGSWLTRIETAVTAAAGRRARLALQAGDAVGARHAVRQGLKLAPESEALLMLSMNATKLIAGDDALGDEFMAALNEAEECGYDLTPETHRFYKTLMQQPVLASVGGGVPRSAEARETDDDGSALEEKAS